MCFVLQVLYCTLLAAAQSDQERGGIEDSMRNEPELSEILHQLLEGESEDASQVGKPHVIFNLFTTYMVQRPACYHFIYA